jgi:penicillin-binding protein 1C
MGLAGTLSPDGVREAMAERLALAHEPAVFVAPHFVQRVLALDEGACGHAEPRTCESAARHQRQVAPGVGPQRQWKNVGRQPRIETTLDVELQREVEGIIRAERRALERHGAHNVAVVVLDNASGEWLAWEGSGDYTDAAHGGTIDGVTTARQPGSALKPFTYAIAFEEGESPATVLPDVTSYFPTADEGVLYSPRNYDGQFRGPLLARRALAGSQNVPAVALASRVGVPDLLRFLRGAGFTTFDKTASYYGLGLTLGNAEVRLDELVTAYAMFARGGVAVRPALLRGHGSTDGDRIVSPRTAFWITDILSDDDARAYAFGRGGSLEFPFPVAAKTGTSQAYHDNWTVGYTRAVTVGVWVGNFDRRPLVGSSGVTGAGPIFHGVMLAAMRRASGSVTAAANNPATEAPPARTVRRPVCALSGLAPTAACPTRLEEWTPEEAPSRPCSWHRPTPRGVVVAWPAEYHAWAASERLLDRVVAPVADDLALISDRRGGSSDPPDKRHGLKAVPYVLRIVSPPDGAIYFIDPTLRREFQTIGLRASIGLRDRVNWQVDGVAVGSVESGAALDWPLAAGRHVISVHDGQGRRANATIVVK